MFGNKVTLFLTMFLVTAITVVYGQSSWSINSSLQYASGNYLSDQRLNSWYLYGGIRYETSVYSVALSIPFIASNGQNVSQFGNIYMPNHMGSGSSVIGGMGGHSGGHMMGNQSPLVTSGSIEYYGIGDLYFYANYNIVNQFTSPLGISVDGYIKFPTASTVHNFGTGKFDFSLSGTLRKNLGSFLVYAAGGFIFIGNTDSVNYNNPLTLNLGVGKIWGYGNISTLLSYSVYSKILDIYQTPQQVSLGVNIISNFKVTYTLIGSAGLSNSTADYAFSAGIKYNL